MKNRFLGGLAAAAMLSTGFALTTAGVASAHSKTAASSCETGLEVSANADYEGGSDNNKLTMTVAGVTTSYGFGSGGITKTIPFAQGGVTTTWSWSIDANITSGDPTAFDTSGSGSTGPCGAIKPPQPPATIRTTSYVECPLGQFVTSEFTTLFVYDEPSNSWKAGQEFQSNQMQRPATPAELNEAKCAAPDQPKPEVVVTTTEAPFACGDKFVTVATITTATPYIYDQAARTWVPSPEQALVTKSESTRALTDQEVAKCLINVKAEVKVVQPTCESPGKLVGIENAGVTWKDIDGGISAGSKDGYQVTGQTDFMFEDYALEQLTGRACATQPKDEVVTGEATFDVIACDSKEFVTRQTVSTTRYVWNAETSKWVEGMTTVEDNVTKRPLSSDELAARDEGCTTTMQPSTSATTPASEVDASQGGPVLPAQVPTTIVSAARPIIQTVGTLPATGSEGTSVTAAIEPARGLPRQAQVLLRSDGG